MESSKEMWRNVSGETESAAVGLGVAHQHEGELLLAFWRKAKADMAAVTVYSDHLAIECGAVAQLAIAQGNVLADPLFITWLNFRTTEGDVINFACKNLFPDLHIHIQTDFKSPEQPPAGIEIILVRTHLAYPEHNQPMPIVERFGLFQMKPIPPNQELLWIGKWPKAP